MHDQATTALSPLVEDAIARQVTPGAVLLVGRGDRTLFHDAWGLTAAVDELGVPVRPDTIYDVASVTKAAVTATLLMRLVARGRLSLDSPARDWLPELIAPGGDAIKVGHLAGHGAGLPDHQLFYERIWAGDLAGASSARDALVVMAGATPLLAAPGERCLYSDLGYILLARLLERVADKRLDEAFRDEITAPLGLADSFFVDVSNNNDTTPPLIARIAPTEHCPKRGLLRGQVHDENAHAGGGICGHAGLFSTADDLGRLAAALCHSFQGASGSLLPQDIVRHFWSTTAVPGVTRCLGWDRPDPAPGVSHAGDLWPRDGVGHLGFTGSSLWLAPKTGHYAVLLSNRVYYSREKAGIKSLRRAVMDTVSKTLLAL